MVIHRFWHARAELPDKGIAIDSADRSKVRTEMPRRRVLASAIRAE
jgi:hypothetical protein